jgi:ribosomal protein S18 acetylase RimI-like enzyme
MAGEELRDSADVAARALHDDPLFAHLAPDVRLRRRGMPLYFRANLGATARLGVTTVARRQGRVVGVASWVPPGRWPLSPGNQVRQAFGALRALVLRPRSIPDALRILRAIERVHTHEPHWYLSLLGVDPAQQGHGIGAALIEGGIARADDDGLPAYLETSNPKNLAWYRRFGFEIEQELRVGANRPAIWTMRRPVRD